MAQKTSPWEPHGSAKTWSEGFGRTELFKSTIKLLELQIATAKKHAAPRVRRMLDNIALEEGNSTGPIVAVHIGFRVILPRLRLELLHKPNEKELSHHWRLRA